MDTAQDLIEQLDLRKHPEGGYYRETYRSRLEVKSDIERAGFTSKRNICTSIYFLLPSTEKSLLHRIKSDEIWHYHQGSSLSLYVICDNQLFIHRLGCDVQKGEKFQIVVSAHSWFGAIVNEQNSFTLSGCTVSPGFDFTDFELGKRDELLSTYPAFAREITLLTKP